MSQRPVIVELGVLAYAGVAAPNTRLSRDDHRGGWYVEPLRPAGTWPRVAAGLKRHARGAVVAAVLLAGFLAAVVVAMHQASSETSARAALPSWVVPWAGAWRAMDPPGEAPTRDAGPAKAPLAAPATRAGALPEASTHVGFRPAAPARAKPIESKGKPTLPASPALPTPSSSKDSAGWLDARMAPPAPRQAAPLGLVDVPPSGARTA